MSQKIVSETLIGLGLTDRDSEVFISLAKKGLSRARDIQKTLGINKAQLYRSLRNLQARGIVEATLDYPARFNALPFGRVLDLFIEGKKSEARRLEESRESIMSCWNSLAVEESSGYLDKFMVIKGENRIYSKIGQMAKDAKRHILLSASELSIIEAEKNNLIESALELEIPLKVVTNVTKKNKSIIKKVLERIGSPSQKYMGRHIDLEEKFFPKFVLYDEEELIFLMTAEEKTSSHLQTDTALWTNNKALVDAFATFFNQLWRDARTDVRERISELETGKTSPETIFIRDPEVAYQKYLSLISSAQREIAVLSSTKGIKDLIDDNVILEDWKNRKVETRIMAPITKENEDVASKLSEYCDIRHIQMNYLGQVIVDKKQLLDFKPPSDNDLHSPSANFANAFYTDDPKYVQARVELFNDLWDSSSDAIKELKRSEASFRSIYENSFDAILLTTPSGHIFSANHAAQRMLGMSEDEIKRVGREGVLVMDEKAKTAFREGKRKGKAKAKLTYKRKDGSTFQGETTSGHFTDADGTRKVSVIIREM